MIERLRGQEKRKKPPLRERVFHGRRNKGCWTLNMARSSVRTTEEETVLFYLLPRQLIMTTNVDLSHGFEMCAERLERNRNTGPTIVIAL